MTFGEQNSLSQSFQLLDKAFQSGINFYDSAEMYPVSQRPETQGRSEEYMGRWIRSRNIPRDSVVLATKGGTLKGNQDTTCQMLYYSIAKKYDVHPVSLAIGDMPIIVLLQSNSDDKIQTIRAAFDSKHPLVASAVFGTTTLWQLQEVLDGCRVELTPEIIAKINEVHSAFPNPCPSKKQKQSYLLLRSEGHVFMLSFNPEERLLVLLVRSYFMSRGF